MRGKENFAEGFCSREKGALCSQGACRSGKERQVGSSACCICASPGACCFRGASRAPSWRHIHKAKSHASSPAAAAAAAAATAAAADTVGGDPTAAAELIRSHSATSREVLQLCRDLQVLGRSEFKQLLKW